MGDGVFDLILVTGANGFVGDSICIALRAHGKNIRRAVRTSSACVDFIGDESIVIGDINRHTEWNLALRKVTTVIHLAARAHMINEPGSDFLTRYREVNVEGTKRLAEMAAKAGVKRFVFLSSAKVNGERTSTHPFTENDVPQPEDAYGNSKWVAEQSLLEVARATGIEAVILRPPLVYGAGVKGNFLRLLQLVARGVPLPLASVSNRRSLLYIENLVDAIVSCINLPASASRTYLVSDGEDVSTPELIRSLATALDVRARLFPCPLALLELGSVVFGKTGEVSKLTDSLQVDSNRIRRELGWQPRFSLAQGLKVTAHWYRQAACR